MIIVADTSVVVALIDAADSQHHAIGLLHAADPSAWLLPWAILPEVDYMLGSHVSKRSQGMFLDDLACGAFRVDWGQATDLKRAHELHAKYHAMHLGLVDGIVLATAERLRADAIATLDLRHFSAVVIRGRPQLYPRDLP